MSYVEPFDRDRIVTTSIDSVQSALVGNMFYEMIKQLDNLDGFRCFFVYLPSIFITKPELTPLASNNSDDMESKIEDWSQRNISDMKSYLHYKMLEIELKRLLPGVDAFFGEHGDHFRICRVFDFLYFVDTIESVDPMIFKLTTSAHVAALPEVNLKQILTEFENVQLSRS